MIHIHTERWLKIEIANTLNDRIGMQKVLDRVEKWTIYNRTTFTGDGCNFLRIFPTSLNVYGQHEIWIQYYQLHEDFFIEKDPIMSQGNKVSTKTGQNLRLELERCKHLHLFRNEEPTIFSTGQAINQLFYSSQWEVIPSDTVIDWCTQGGTGGVSEFEILV